MAIQGIQLVLMGICLGGFFLIIVLLRAADRHAEERDAALIDALRSLRAGIDALSAPSTASKAGKPQGEPEEPPT